MKTMFCPKCGSNNQNVDSYCTKCGNWLPDFDALASRKLFKKLTREQKIEEVRILEVVSVGLCLTSAAIIYSIIIGANDIKMLFLPLICCVLVAIYQLVNFYLGYKLHKRVIQPDSSINQIPNIENKGELKAATTNQLVNKFSVTENTTKPLQNVSVSRRSDQDK